ncbi:MAG: tetratricopeptide repeat protein [Deltaproteobacteria bacterium]|nr:tetratricopeptide repeat protein [Deltaproteobacteria bacterium]
MVTLLGGSASAQKFTHSPTVQVKPALTERSKPPPKREAPQGPTSSQILQIQSLLGTIHTEQITILKDELIPNTPDSNVVEKSDYYFRLGEIYAKLHQLHRLKSAEAEIARDGERDVTRRAALAKQSADHKAKAKQALLDTVGTYQKFVDNPLFVSAPKVDIALFYMAYTLQSAGYLKEARVAYDKLLRNYPTSRFVPEAHLAFAEAFFEQRQLADAEARYKLVLKFPKSSVYRFAQYKLGWVAYNLGKFADAMQAFNEVIQGTRNDPTKAMLHRSASKDFVRAYAEIGKADKALLTFKRVSAGDGIGNTSGLTMLSSLSDHYLDQGKSDKAIYVLRELMTQQPKHKNVCLWEHSIARSMMTLPSATGDDRVAEIEALTKLYAALQDKSVLPKAELVDCRDAAAEMSGQLARAYHQEGVKTRNPEQLRLAGRLYRAYLGAFQGAPDFAETQYFHAELAWVFAELEKDPRLAVVKWEATATAFSDVLERGKLPAKLIQISAYAAMLARMKSLQIDPRVRQEKVDEAAYDRVALPKQLPENETKLLAAFDGYLKHVRDPNDSERIDVMFHRANLLRRFDRFAEAIPALEVIVLQHGTHETAPWALQLVLDSYNRLKNYEGMFAFANKVPPKVLALWPEGEITIKDLQRQQLRKQGEEHEKQAKASGNLELYVACANKNVAAYNMNPLSDDADQILYNAGVCFELGKSISAAKGMYLLLQQHFPKSKLAAKSVARLGNALASIAFYKEAAEKLEEYATKYAGEDNAFPALSDAVQFRKGIGDDAKALANTRQFIQMFGKTKPAEAATAFFSMTSIYEKQGDLDKLAAHLRAYLVQWGSVGGGDRRVIAQAKLGQALWQAACPVATIDGTCMRMTRVASLGRQLRVAADGIPKRCGDATQAELEVIPRDERKVKAALAAFTAATAEYERGGITGDTRGALYHYALAKFGKVERQYEQYLAMQIPANLTFSTRQPAIADQSRKRFLAWFEGKSKLGVAMKNEYVSIIALKDGAIAIASAARLGAISQNFSVQLFRAEIPVDQRTGPYAEETSQAYCDELTLRAEPLQQFAETSYEACLLTSTKLGWFSEWSRACERELGQLLPDRYPKAFELRRSPDAFARIVDVEKAPTL